MEVLKTKRKRVGALLKGLQPILEALSLEFKDVAERLDMHPNHLSRLAKLKQGTGHETVTALAQTLCCEEIDLLTEPSPVRLAQIVADNDEAKAKKSRANALSLAKKARAC